MSIYDKKDYFQDYLDAKNISLDNHYEISPLEKKVDFVLPWQKIVDWANDNRDRAIHKSIEPVRPFIPDDSLRQTAMLTWIGYNKHNTQEWNWGIEPEDNRFFKRIIGQTAFDTLNIDMETSMVRLLQYDPGQMLPIHTDSYNGFKDQYGDGKITRWFVAVTPWDWGHMLQIHDNMIWGYDSGYAVEIKDGVFHLSSNCGINPKYTFTITGFIKE